MTLPFASVNIHLPNSPSLPVRLTSIGSDTTPSIQTSKLDPSGDEIVPPSASSLSTMTELERSKQVPLKLLMFPPVVSPFSVPSQLTLKNLNSPELKPEKSKGRVGLASMIVPFSSTSTI